MIDFPMVYVVILAFNHYEATRRALSSLQALTYPDFKVLVLDNGSTDETLVRLPHEFPEVHLHSNASNVGFAAGINVGIRIALEAGADYVFVLNNDVIVDPHILEPLVRAASADVGAVAPLIYSVEEPDRIWSAGFKRHPLLLEMRGGSRGKLANQQLQGMIEVDFLIGCASLLHAEVLREVGLFDERYFFYYEDLDLSMRIQAHGYRLLVVPSARLWHQGAATAGPGSPFNVYQMARGSVLFFRSHARGLQRPLILLVRTASSLKKSLGFMLSGRWNLVCQHWLGIRDGWCEPCGM